MVGGNLRRARSDAPYYEGCQSRSERRAEFFLKSGLGLFSFLGGSGFSKRDPGLGVSGGKPVLLLLSVHDPHNGAAHHDVCGPGQETSAPNLPTGSLPTQGRSGRAPFQIVLLPPSGFRSGWVVRGGAFFSPRSSPIQNPTVRHVWFSSATGPPPFVWQWPRWLSCALPC